MCTLPDNGSSETLALLSSSSFSSSLSLSLCLHVATLRWNLDTQEIYCNITLDRDSIQLGRSGHYSTFGHVLVTS